MDSFVSLLSLKAARRISLLRLGGLRDFGSSASFEEKIKNQSNFGGIKNTETTRTKQQLHAHIHTQKKTCRRRKRS
jgi:hypothetical protein